MRPPTVAARRAAPVRLAAPISDEITLSFGMTLPRGGWLKATYVDREVDDIVEDFLAIENGITTITDPLVIDADGIVRWRNLTENWRVRVRPDSVIKALAGLGAGLLLITRPWTGVTLGLLPAFLLLRAAVRRRRWSPRRPRCSTRRPRPMTEGRKTDGHRHGGHHRDAEDVAEPVDVDLAAAAVELVEHIEHQHHGVAELGKLQG